jgi:hypothetical protein
VPYVRDAKQREPKRVSRLPHESGASLQSMEFCAVVHAFAPVFTRSPLKTPQQGDKPIQKDIAV